MINPVDINQARAFARQDGTFLGLIWIASFLLTVRGVNQVGLGLLANILMLSTPFFVAWRLKEFRDGALNGVISFRRALFYCFETFFYATMLTTAAQFLYFKFIDLAGFVAFFTETYNQMMSAYHILTEEEMKQTATALAMMSPLGWAALFMLDELLAGVVLSPFIAAIMKRNFRSFNIDKQN